jgi:hypothetical protein
MGTTDLIIVRATSTPHLDAFCDDWIPFDAAKRALLGPWDWAPFDWHIIIPSRNLLTMAAVDPNNDRLEGLIAVDPDARQDALVVEWLQTSPRNYGSGRARSGVGTMLLRWAVKHSESLGRKGALSLASIPSAESFYDALHFVPVGRNARQQKLYDLPATRVARFRREARLGGVGSP